MSTSKSIAAYVWWWAKKQITSQDNYSKTVWMSFNGNDSYQTFYGGATTLLIKIGVLIISVLLTISIFQKGNTTTSVNRVIQDITNDPTKHYFAK